MGKAEKEHMLRLEGMEYALDIVKAKGVEGLEAELRRRSRKYVPLSISQDELNQFCDKVKQNTFQNALILVLVTLRDEFGFGEKRLMQMMRRFWDKAGCIADDYTTLDDQVGILAEECNMDVKVSDVDLTVKINRGKAPIKVSAADVGIKVG